MTHQQDNPVHSAPPLITQILGPTFIAAFPTGAIVLLVGGSLYGTDQIGKHPWLLWLGIGLYVFFLVLLHWVNQRISHWKIEHGVVFKGGRPLFQLAEILATQHGLPDNWITAISKIPGVKYAPRGNAWIALQRFQENMLVVQLSERRWFIWSGLEYKNADVFRNRLLAAANGNTIDDIPDTILSRLRPPNHHRVLTET